MALASSKPHTPTLERAAALAKLRNIAEIHLESNPSLRRILVTVSDLPIFSLLLRSCRSSPFAFSCFLCVANPCQNYVGVRHLPSSVTSAPQSLPNIGFALGEFASSFATSRCYRFIL